MTTPVRAARTALLVAAAGAATVTGVRAGGRALVLRTERRLCVTVEPPPYDASERARALHRGLLVADLHADSLLWGRDLLQRSGQGQVDVPRLIEGNVALQVLAASTKSPRHLNIERNDDRSDDIILLALAGGWPRATWRSLLARALHKADRANAMESRSEGRFTLIRSRADLDAYVARRANEPAITAGLLAIEGAHALDDDPANVEVVADAGFRMMSPSHFFDNAFGGSAHGVEKGGLTRAGREMIRRMEARGMVLDLAHASGPTIEEAVAMSRRPVIVSHTGVRGTCDNARNLSDEQLRADRRDGRADRDRVLAHGLRRRRCRVDRALGPLRDRGRGGRARGARIRLRRRGPGALRRERDGAAHRCAAGRGPRRRPDREGHGRERVPPSRGHAAGCLSRTRARRPVRRARR